MTVAQLEVVGVLVAIISGIGSVIFLSIQAARDAAKTRRDEIRDQVEAARQPLRDELAAMTKDRDYWRTRANQYEDRAQNRGGNA